LQFDVVQFRLESEYGADSKLERTPWQLLRWVDPAVDSNLLTDLRLPPGVALAEDTHGQPVILFDAEWALKYFTENNPKITLHLLSPNLQPSAA
jgi:peptide chain release factor 3